MKYLVTFLSLLCAANAGKSQIPNNNFEIWDSYNGRAKPALWTCPNLCASPTCGPCDRIVDDKNDLSVRIHNVMPCVSLDHQAKSRNSGFIETYFVSPYDKFKLSYDLKIDSIEQPASFILTLRGVKPDGRKETFLTWIYEDYINGRIEHEIELLHPYDSIFIQFKVKGFEKINALHDCDLGYLSATIDRIELERTVSTNESLMYKIKVYPNPVSDILFVEMEDYTAIEEILIFDALGKIADSFTDFRTGGKLDISGLAPGFYIGEMLLKDGRPYTFKFFKH